MPRQGGAWKLLRQRQRGEAPPIPLCPQCGTKALGEHAPLCSRCWRKTPEGREFRRLEVAAIRARRRQAAAGS